MALQTNSYSNQKYKEKKIWLSPMQQLFFSRQLHARTSNKIKYISSKFVYVTKWTNLDHLNTELKASHELELPLTCNFTDATAQEMPSWETSQNKT